MKKDKHIVAIIQSFPVYYDLEKSITKAERLIKEAVKKKAELIVFGETWLPGYPAWLDFCPDAALWNHKPVKEVFASLRKNCPTIPGKETEYLGKLAKKFRATIVMGLNERVEQGPGNGTLYNALITIGINGKILNHHRKLVPTYTEKMVWGQGDGAGLQAVNTTTGRVGGLICWEHWMPLSRQALHTSGENIHIAVWPTVHEMHQVASRHYAFEGRCFVLAAGLIMKAGDLPLQLNIPHNLRKNPEQLILKGGSAIIGPDGRYIAGPVYDKETILTAAIDLYETDQEKMTLDVSGHYFRNDIFELKVNKKRK